MVTNAAFFTKRHSWGIIFALFVGLCTAIPSFLPPLLLGDQYKGVPFVADNDENTYRARVHEILDGHFGVASPNLYEYKDRPGVVPPVNEYFYALPAFVFGLTLVILLSKFALPALLFFLVYLFAMRIVGGDDHAPRTAPKWSAIAAGLFVILGFDALGVHNLLSLVLGGGTYQPILWTRLVNPIIGALVLLIFLHSLWRIGEGRGRPAIIIGGISMAISVGYFFSFGIIASILFAALVFYFAKGYHGRFRSVLFVALIGVACSLPYWFHAFGAVGGEEGRLLAMKNGMFFTHAPVLNKFLFVVTVFVLLSFCFAHFFQRRREEVLLWQYVALVLTGCWIALNEQVITGRTIWYYHFAQYTTPIAFIVFFVVAHHVWRKEFPRAYAALLGTIVAVAVLLLGVFSFSFRNEMDAFRASQSNGDLLAFLNSRAPRECVVLIKEEGTPVEQMIPAYTHCNVYSTTYIFNGIPNDRVLHNFLLRLRLAGVGMDDVHEYLLAHQSDVRNYFFDDWTENFGNGVDPWLLGKISLIETAYGPFLQKDLKSELLAYRMDYLVSQEPLVASLADQLPGLELVATTSRYYLYSFGTTN